MSLLEQHIVVGPPQVGRVDRVVQLLTGKSRSHVRGLFDHSCVRVNGEICRDSDERATLGDRISVRHDPTQRYPERPKTWRERAFSVAFEDEHLIVVDKEAGVLSVPTDRGERNSLFDRVAIYLRHRRGRVQPIIVHRLDRGVSGLMVLAKTLQAADGLRALFRGHQIVRIYVGVVDGRLDASSGRFESFLATGKNLDRFSTAQQGAGERAITHYRLLQQSPDCAVVEVKLETGRRNQIRVHFAEAGHPVLGDPRYGRGRPARPDWNESRIALHAVHLAFRHPITGSSLRLDSPLPEPMRKFLANWRPGLPIPMSNDPSIDGQTD